MTIEVPPFTETPKCWRTIKSNGGHPSGPTSFSSGSSSARAFLLSKPFLLTLCGALCLSSASWLFSVRGFCGPIPKCWQPDRLGKASQMLASFSNVCMEISEEQHLLVVQPPAIARCMEVLSPGSGYCMWEAFF